VDLAAPRAGLDPEAQVQLDQIKLVNPEWEDMRKGEDGLIRQKDGALIEPDVNVTVAAGFIEGSNVNTIHEFTEVLSLSRQYEMQVKMMRTVQQNSEASSRLLSQS